MYEYTVVAKRLSAHTCNCSSADINSTYPYKFLPNKIFWLACCIMLNNNIDVYIFFDVCMVSQWYYCYDLSHGRLLENVLLPSWDPVKKPLFTLVQHRKLVNFCNHHEHWTESDWEKVVFDDRSTFCQLCQWVSGAKGTQDTNHAAQC